MADSLDDTDMASLDVDEQQTKSSSFSSSSSSGTVSRLTLVASDTGRLVVDGASKVQALFLCGFFKAALEGDKSCTELPVPVTTDTLRDIVTFLMLRDGKTIADFPSTSLQCFDMDVLCQHSPQDAAFIKDIATDNERLFNLILAANQLECKPLLQLASLQQACILGKTGTLGAMMERLRRRPNNNVASVSPNTTKETTKET